MPYVDADARIRLDGLIDHLAEFLYNRPAGELDYTLTRLADAWLNGAGAIRFERLALLNGVLDLIRAEYQRRIVNPYEDAKIAAHGDVYIRDWLPKRERRR